MLTSKDKEDLLGIFLTMSLLLSLPFLVSSCVKYNMNQDKIVYAERAKEFKEEFGTHGKVVDIYSYYGNDKFHTPRTTAVLENDEGERIQVPVNDLIPLEGETWYVEWDGSYYNSKKLVKKKGAATP